MRFVSRIAALFDASGERLTCHKEEMWPGKDERSVISDLLSYFPWAETSPNEFAPHSFRISPFGKKVRASPHEGKTGNRFQNGRTIVLRQVLV